MIGVAFGHVKMCCLDPVADLYNIARYVYMPKVRQINEMAKHGISIGIDDEVVFV